MAAIGQYLEKQYGTRVRQTEWDKDNNPVLAEDQEVDNILWYTEEEWEVEGLPTEVEETKSNNGTAKKGVAEEINARAHTIGKIPEFFFSMLQGNPYTDSITTRATKLNKEVGHDAGSTDTVAAFDKTGVPPLVMQNSGATSTTDTSQ
eukprot:5410062-Ditylum_brightwellii.AAC.1